MNAEVPDHSQTAHRFTPEERTDQLREFDEVCSQLADLLQDNGERRAAGLIHELQERAGSLLAEGFSRSQLTELGGAYPWYPTAWLNPRAREYDSSLSDWQRRAVDLHERARAAALNLRADATW